MRGPCQCWTWPPYLHDGHCCMAYWDHDYDPAKPLPCGHEVEGRALADAARAQRDQAVS